VIAEIDRLLDHHTCRAIADDLNSRGFTPSYGKPFHGPMVARIAKDHGLKTRWERLREEECSHSMKWGSGWVSAQIR
jgi:hypothetical protein